MFRISVKREFDAAHKLEGHPGKCSNLHGHTWKVEAVFERGSVNKLGFVLDFDEAGSALEEIVSEFDHNYMNEVPPFDRVPPTAENIAEIIFERLKGKIEGPTPDVKLESVTVWESNLNWAQYSTDKQ